MNEYTIDTIKLDGGKPCLDFINTIHDRTAAEPIEYLKSYQDVIAWSSRAGLLNESEENQLAGIAKGREERAGSVFRKAIEVRDLLYELFWPVSKNEVPADSVQDRFNILLSNALHHKKLRLLKNMEVEQDWKEKTALELPVWKIVNSAYELLISGQLQRVKECGACGWLFLDQSKNRSRKWCSMQSCGSNVKAKRYYHRKKKADI